MIAKTILATITVHAPMELLHIHVTVRLVLLDLIAKQVCWDALSTPFLLLLNVTQIQPWINFR